MKFKDFEYEVKFGLAKITSYTGNDKRVEIPSKIGHYNVYTLCQHSFLGLKNLEEVVIPKSVGKIEDSAFVGCENLKKIEIGIVEDFGKAFEDCSSNLKFYTESPRMACKIENLGENYDIFCEKDFKIAITDEEAKECDIVKVRPRSTNLIIPDEIQGYKVTRLEFSLGTKRSFSKVRLPKYLKEIPYEFFAYQRYLKEIEIGENIERIGANAFYLCGTETKQTLRFSKKLKSIGSTAFSSDSIRVEFEDGTELEEIDVCGFQNSEVDFSGVKNFPLKTDGIFIGANVKNLKLNETHVEIPKKTFTNATLDNFSGLENVRKIDSRSFAETHFTKKMDFNLENIDEVENNAFDSSEFAEFRIPKNLKLNEGMFRNSKASRIIFDEDYAFDEIPRECFYSMRNLIEIELPKAIKRIGNSAFYYCTNLKEINLESVEKIGSNVFYRTNIRELKFGKNLRSLERCAFQNLNSLETVEFDEDSEIKEIPDSCFYGAQNLEKVVLSKNTKKIASTAFKLTNVSSINLENIEVLGEESFNYTKLEKVDIPKVEEIPSNCFYKCSYLKTVSCGPNLKKIGTGAFAECIKLENFEFPNNLESIDSYAFRNTAFVEVKLPDKLEVLDTCFIDCKKLKKLVLGNETKIISSYALNGINSLEVLDLNKVEMLESCAIVNCNSLKELVIPETTTRLGYDSISCCGALEDVKIEGTLSELELGVFSHCPNLLKVQTDDVASGKKLLSRKTNGIKEIIPITETSKKTRGRKKKEEI